MKLPNMNGGSIGRCRTGFFPAGWLLFPLLAACGFESRVGADHDFVAKVNGDVITIRELNEQYSRIDAPSGMGAKISRKQILDAIVDEKLLAQKASESGLEQEPETAATLERARREVLAHALVDRAARGAGVSPREIKAFYESRPELFERRKTYVFRRFDVLAGELQSPVKAELGKAKTPADVATILKRAKLAFSDQTEIRAVDMLPPAISKRAADMRIGDILMFGEVRQIVLMQLVRSVAEPLDLAQATPSIRIYLAREKRISAAESLLKDLRQTARIEYAEKFTDGFQTKTDAGRFETIAGVQSSKALPR